MVTISESLPEVTRTAVVYASDTYPLVFRSASVTVTISGWPGRKGTLALVIETEPETVSNVTVEEVCQPFLDSV
jgi:hypothetical protein